MLLNEDALELFLPKLKGHLEAVQVCLGEIEEWLQQPYNILALLNELFGKELEIPEDIDPLNKSRECCYCKSSLSYQSRYDRCSFERCKTELVLSESVVSGRHDIKFDLTQECDHAVLKRFLHFLWG